MLTQKQKAIKRKHIARINHLLATMGDKRELQYRQKALATLLASNKRV